MSIYDDEEERRRSDTASGVIDFAGDVLEVLVSGIGGTVEVAGSCIEGIGCVIGDIFSSL